MRKLSVASVVVLALCGAAAPSTRPAENAGARDLVKEGRQFAERGEHRAAIGKYDQAIDADRSCAEAHAWKASSLLSLKRPAEAQQEISVARSLGVPNAAFDIVAGRVCVALNQVKEARRLYDSAARLAPRQAGAFYADLAAALAGRGDQRLGPEIESALKSAAAASPPDANALFDLGQSYAKAGRADGLGYLRRYIEVSVKLPEAHRDQQKMRLARQMIRALEILHGG